MKPKDQQNSGVFTPRTRWERSLWISIPRKRECCIRPWASLTSYVPNRYLLVNVVARRARQIAEEAEEAGEHLDEKPVTLAIDEVAEGRIDASQMDLTIEEENVRRGGRGTATTRCAESCER